jgi:DNA-binding XRE family transcriptional regulator
MMERENFMITHMRMHRNISSESLDSLSKALGINIATLSLIETGRLKPTVDQFEKLKAHFSRCDPDKLLQPFKFSRRSSVLRPRLTEAERAVIDKDITGAAADLVLYRREKERLIQLGREMAKKINSEK